MAKLIKATPKEIDICRLLQKKIEPSKLVQADFTNITMIKPWGMEYMNYEAEDKSCCSWFLHIKPNLGTSIHCHATKTTYIHVIDGSIVLRLLDRKPVIMKSGDSLLLEKKVFHSMTAQGEGARLLEMEAPSFKPDAIRFKDGLNRVGKNYEYKSKILTL
jgi:mannose-6-phosphate isomerase-like protein (cupin superfamily)